MCIAPADPITVGLGWLQVGIDALTTMLAQEYNQLPGLSPQASKTAVGSTTDTIKRWLTLNKFEKEVLVAEEKKDTYPAVQPLLYGTYQAYLRRSVWLEDRRRQRRDPELTHQLL